MKDFIQILFLTVEITFLNCKPFVLNPLCSVKAENCSALRVSVKYVHSKDIKQVQNCVIILLTSWRLTTFQAHTSFFYRNAIGKSHTNTKFSH